MGGWWVGVVRDSVCLCVVGVRTPPTLPYVPAGVQTTVYNDLIDGRLQAMDAVLAILQRSGALETSRTADVTPGCISEQLDRIQLSSRL